MSKKSAEKKFLHEEPKTILITSETLEVFLRNLAHISNVITCDNFKVCS